MKPIRLPVWILLTILVYVVLHIAEEAIGNFPVFMHQNWGIPDIGLARWLFHNILFFLPVLLGAYLVYISDEQRFLPFGLGISFWGVLNFLEHAFYSIKNQNISPGFYSSLFYVAIAVGVIVTLYRSKMINLKLIGLSILLSLFYWSLSILLVVLFASRVAGIFI